jgi:hypothetical protein
MSLQANALVTLALARSYLSIPSTSTDFDPIIEMFINQVSDQCEKYCGRYFKTASYTQYIDGGRGNLIVVDQYPITAVASIHLDSTRAFEASSLVPSTDYIVNPNDIELVKNLIPFGVGSCKVVYTAGYAVIPSDLQAACLFAVDYYYRMRSDKRIGRSGVNKGGEGVSYIDGLPKDVFGIWDNYRRADIFGQSRQVFG